MTGATSVTRLGAGCGLLAGLCSAVPGPVEAVLRREAVVPTGRDGRRA